jgi:hypothetical protein
MNWLRTIGLTLGVLTMLAPIAHVLELPNKLSLDANVMLPFGVRRLPYEIKELALPLD